MEPDGGDGRVGVENLHVTYLRYRLSLASIVLLYYLHSLLLCLYLHDNNVLNPLIWFPEKAKGASAGLLLKDSKVIFIVDFSNYLILNELS